MRKGHFFLLLIFCYVFYACSENPEKEDSSEGLNAELTEDSRLKAIITNGLASQAQWTRQWESVLSLTADGFELMRMDTIQDLTMPERNPILEDDPLFPYQFEHPEGNGRLDLYSSKVEARRNSSEAFLNPDSKVVWYRNDGMKETLLFMGPSGMLEDGRWISSQEFLVVGYLHEEEGYRPMIWLIDVNTDRLYQYAFKDIAQTYDPTAYLEGKLSELALK